MRLLSALAILFLLGPAVSSASNQRSDSDGSAGDPSHAAELRRAFGFDSDPATVARAAVDSASFPNRTYGIPLSLDEAAEVSRRIRVQLSLGGAITELETRPDWAGVWIDQEAGAVPVFQFAGEGEAPGIADLLPSGAEWRVEFVPRPLSDLTALRDRIVNDMPRLSAAGVEVNGVGIDLPNNRVRVTVDFVDALASSTLTTRFGDELLIEQGNRAVADVCPETQCYPLKGGIGMLGKGGGWPCTVGYLARRTDVSPDVSRRCDCGALRSTWKRNYR